MNRKRNHWVVVVIVAAIVFATGWVFMYRPKVIDEIVGVGSTRHLPDEALIANFLRNRTDFELLRKMIGEDTGVLFVSNDRVLYVDSVASNIRTERLNNYRTLLRGIGVKDISISFDRRIIELTSSRRGFATHNSQKSYMYIESSVFGDDLLESLDGLSANEVGSGLRRIDGDWYLHFEGY
jgi:hypothetical protein